MSGPEVDSSDPPATPKVVLSMTVSTFSLMLCLIKKIGNMFLQFKNIATYAN